MTARRELVVWGASGHALVVADIVRLRGEYEIVGFLDDVNPDRQGLSFGGSHVLGGREQLARLSERGVKDLILGFGDCRARLTLGELVRRRGFSLATVVHPSAIVAADASLGAGSVIVAGSVVNPGARLGESVIVNTGATVDHECVIGDAVHLGPGVHLGGRVTVEEGAWVGIGTVVRDGVRIGAHAVIGAGAVVVDDVAPGVVAYGVPARAIRAVEPPAR